MSPRLNPLTLSLTQWYRKYEISWRISLFFSAATAAGAFGGLLARLINLMDGVGGYYGWVSGTLLKI